MPHGLQQAIDDVKAFHDKHNFDVGISVPELNVSVKRTLVYAAKILADLSKLLEGYCEDAYNPHLLRAHLSVEELGEYLEAVVAGDKVKMLDALADRQYVLAGDAVTFGLPLAEAFEEVQRSNMTKVIRNPDDLRLRDKGESYVPPDMARVLAMYENVRMFPRVLLINLAMHEAGCLQEHHGWWAMLEKPIITEPGASVVFECHGKRVDAGIIVRVREPSGERPADWTGRDFESSWWIVEYTNTALEFARET